MPMAGKICAHCRANRPIASFGLAEDNTHLRPFCRQCEKVIANTPIKKRTPRVNKKP